MNIKQKPGISPEPWQVVTDTAGARRWIIDGAGIRIAQLFTNFQPIQSCQGNADLMAAAPAMLEALENIENDADQIPASAWHLIKNAIKTAKGNQ